LRRCERRARRRRAPAGAGPPPPASPGTRASSATAAELCSASKRSVRLCPVGGKAQGPLSQRPHGLLAFLGLQPLEEEHPVEVVDLVLEHSSQELVGLDLLLFSAHVEAAQGDLLGPLDVPPELGNRQAAL